MMDTASAHLKIARMPEEFFACGRWGAPFWFIGPEAGMARNGDDLPALADCYHGYRQL